MLTGPRRPRAIRIDKGSEFYNRILQQYLKDQEIKICLCLERDESKCRETMQRDQTDAEKTNLSILIFFIHLQKHRYIDILQDVVQSINKTPNRALNGRTPASVTKENEDEVRFDAY